MRFPVTEREGRSATAPKRLIPGGLTKGLCCEKNEVKKTWQLVELHGCWWAYEGELPPPEAFTTHGRAARHILGPFPTRAMAEAQLPRLLSRRETRAPADRGAARRRARRWKSEAEEEWWRSFMDTFGPC